MVNHSTIQDSGSNPDISTTYLQPDDSLLADGGFYPEAQGEYYPLGSSTTEDLPHKDEICINKELLLWMIYHEQMWKTLAINYALAGGEEAQKFGSKMLENYKKQYPTLEEAHQLLHAILEDQEGVKDMYSRVLDTIENKDSIIKEL